MNFNRKSSYKQAILQNNAQISMALSLIDHVHQKILLKNSKLYFVFILTRDGVIFMGHCIITFDAQSKT